MKLSLSTKLLSRSLIAAAVVLSPISLVNAQVLPSVTRSVTQPIEDLTRRLPANRVTERLTRPEKPALPELLPALTSTLTADLSNALLPVKQAISVVDSLQQTVLREEITPQGELAIAREWVVYASEADLAWFEQSPFSVTKQRYVSLLDSWLVNIQVPDAFNSLNRIKAALPAHLQSQLGRNHVYLTQSNPAEANEEGAAVKESAATTSSVETKPLCETPARIGMLDSAIEDTHPLLSTLQVREHTFIDASLPLSRAHGTAVAGILQQHLAHNSQVVNAAVFYARTQVSQGASLFDLVSGLDWLASQQVPVINMSLTGPDNPLLAKAIAGLSSKGVTLIAAVGNAGPAAPPLFPAAYPDVIGVSAVDAQGNIYRWANQGEQVALSAPGVSVLTARVKGETGPETGTSIASPAVAGWLAQWRTCQSESDTTQTAIPPALRQQLQDKGESGWDPVFGEGAWLPAK